MAADLETRLSRKAARQNEWRQRNREVQALRLKQWREVNPDKNRAHRAVQKAVRLGHLIKPDECSACGQTGRIEAHHHLGYAEEYRLDVTWLCKRCHEAEDARLKRAEVMTHV